MAYLERGMPYFSKQYSPISCELFYLSFNLLLLFLKNITPQIMAKMSGNIIENAKPTFKLSPKAADICPARDGPTRQPKSPDRASKPNIKTPPLGIFSLPMLKEPGHIIPAPIPHKAQPKRDNAG